MAWEHNHTCKVSLPLAIAQQNSLNCLAYLFLPKRETKKPRHKRCPKNNSCNIATYLWLPVMDIANMTGLVLHLLPQANTGG